jgi:predicted GTPase
VPDLQITLVDPHRPGHELRYYPGEVTLRIADVVLINKIDSADLAGIEEVRKNITMVKPDAVVVDAASALDIDDPSMVKGKQVLVVEDGPTLTHGEMKYGAGMVAAKKFGAAGFVDPRPYAVGKLAETFETYSDIGVLLPAMGYGDEQLKDLETTIDKTECDAVVIGTPIDLSRIIKIKKPHTRVYYNLQEIGRPNLTDVLEEFVKRHKLG